MISDRHADAGLMGLLVSVIIVCSGILILVSVLSSSVATVTESTDPHPLINEVLDDGTVRGMDGISRTLSQTAEDPGISAVALDILPLVPGCERITLMSGEPTGIRNSAVMLCMLSCENGETIPCRATLTVWNHA